MRQWYEIRAEAGAAIAEIWIYEQIGEDFWGEGVAAKTFVRDLASLEATHIALHINSPGGNVFDGQAIHNALVRHEATVTTYIDGLAASIASTIALAGDRVVMAENALFMIHNPWGFAMGDATQMRKAADVLDKVGETLVGIYDARSALTREEITVAMDEETWYSASEAVDAGFADEVDGSLKAAACVFDFDALGFRHTPQELRARVASAQSHHPEAGAAAGPSHGAGAAPSRLAVVTGGIFPKGR